MVTESFVQEVLAIQPVNVERNVPICGTGGGGSIFPPCKAVQEQKRAVSADWRRLQPFGQRRWD